MSDTKTEDTAGSIEERVAESKLKTWVLLAGNRWHLTAVLLAVIFLVLVVVGALDPDAFPDDEPVPMLFEALTVAVITGVTIVVTINQLVLSQELGPAGDQRERMDRTMAFREEVETAVGESVMPHDPGRFLASIVDETSQQATRMATSLAPTDAHIQSDVTAFADDLRENAESVSAHLEEANFGSFDVVSAALDYNYSQKLHEARRLQTEYGSHMSKESRAALENTIELLKLYGVAREHIKTLYFQWELTDLSRAVLYAAVPALLVTISGMLYLDSPETVSGSSLGIDNLVWLTSGATAVALVPFVLLLAYVLRITTVAKRTLAIGPFVLRATERSEQSDDE